jgi:hypothetical protein
MSLKHRVARLHAESGAGEAAEERRHRRRVFRERRAVLLYFLEALPEPLKDAAEVEAALLDWIEPLLLQGIIGEDAPLLARMASTLNYHGWIPKPLPVAWVESCLAHPAAEWANGCERCGLYHPTGKVEWVDCQPVHHAPQHPVCLHCGGTVSHLGFFKTHNARWPTPTNPGAFILAGGDLAEFDPMRKQK